MDSTLGMLYMQAYIMKVASSRWFLNLDKVMDGQSSTISFKNAYVKMLWVSHLSHAIQLSQSEMRIILKALSMLLMMVLCALSCEQKLCLNVRYVQVVFSYWFTLSVKTTFPERRSLHK